jgi:hypothetical protein
MERPTRAKKNYRPAQVVLDHTIQRRTSEQVKVDQAKAKADAAAAEAAAAAHKQSQLDQVAALEDAMQEEDAHSLDILRPDLYIDPKSVNAASDVDTLSDSHLMLDDPIEIPRQPLIDLPPDRSSYRDSSHSEEFLTGWQETEENPAVVVEENNDQVQDQDYLMQSDSEVSHVSQAGPSRKAKFKPQYFVSSSFRQFLN